ncbi:MAG TPA: glutamine synthetase family protein [Candidatus Saccharimonadales bacterium]|nr:glutamine synthetase family protein [Candidatus Saccharimonadales bacterium]
MTESTVLKSFLEIPYDQLEEMNLKAKERRMSEDPEKLKAEYREYLKNETKIKAVTLCFSNIEGRLHMLDYDKKFLLDSADNLTFDGSSIRGFTALKESDLRLEIDWPSITWLPSDVFGPGKVMIFANVLNRDKTPYQSDFRGMLKQYLSELREKQNIMAFSAPELVGFLVDGINAEQTFDEKKGFALTTMGGYFHSLPLDKLRKFIDATAEAQRAMGFRNEKDHPEVAPSQFEINFSYSEALNACDQIQMYKLVCRQIANNMNMTATFLPKPIAGINGNGMHTNFSLAKAGKNTFYDPKGTEGLSKTAWNFIDRLLNHASEICLVLSSSVNAYRRLDPHFEAPNQIKVSPNDRGSMIRIPTGNEKTARIEIRSVAPDANPYLLLYTILRTGFEGTPIDEKKKKKVRILPSTIYEAMEVFEKSKFVAAILGKDNKEKYLEFKKAAAERSPKELGTLVKTSEVIYHHEVFNQVLWNNF